LGGLAPDRFVLMQVLHVPATPCTLVVDFWYYLNPAQSNSPEQRFLVEFRARDGHTLVKLLDVDNTTLPHEQYIHYGPHELSATEAAYLASEDSVLLCFETFNTSLTSAMSVHIDDVKIEFR